MTVRRAVGRDRELAALAGAWARVVDDPGAGPVVAVVTGTAGVGKTTLVTAALDRLVPAAGAVLRGCGLPDLPAPHDWTAQALAGLPAGDVPPTRLDAHRALTQQPGPPTPFPPRALLRTGIDLVRLALGAGPGVVVAEDLHALDSASLTLLGELARAVALPALLVVTTREVDGAAEPGVLAELVSILSGRPGLVRVHLDPLPPAQVAELLADHLGDLPDPALVRAVHRRTGGLPFWIGELLATAGTDPVRTLVEGPLPSHLAGLVLSRLAGEEEVVLDVARAAALLGEHVGPGTLADVCGLDPEVVRGAVDRLCARGLLVTGADRATRFRHALAREAVAEAVPSARRRELFERALATAARCGDDVGVTSYARAAGRPELVAGAALRAARRELAAGRPEPAHRLACLGLDAATGRSDGDRLALTVLAARAAHAAGGLDQAARHAESWLAAVTTTGAEHGVGSGAEPAAALRLLADLSWRAGRVDEQWRHLDRALALAEPGGREWVRCLAARARALMRAERNAEALEVADRALAAGRTLGDTRAEPALLVDRGTALWGLGDHAAAAALLEEARQRAEADHDVVTLGRALTNLTAVRLDTLPEDAAWRFHAEATAQADRWGAENSLGKIARSGVDRAIRDGDLDRAWSVAWRRLPVETDPVERVMLTAKAGLLALERGEDARAGGLLERCTPDAETMDQPWVRTYVALLRVAVAARTGTTADAGAALRDYRDCVPPSGHAMRPYRLGNALRWALDAGVPPSQARSVLARCLPAGPVPSRGDGPTAAPGEPCRPDGSGRGFGPELAQAGCALLEAEGDDAGAVRAGLAGLAGERFQAHVRADLHVRLARCLHRLRRGDEAEGHADAALALLRRWPGWRRREAERVAEQVAGRMAERVAGAAGGTDALTSREVDVVRLVSQGLTNYQIGSALGISTRTVAVHVSSVLAKTGCASRTQVALWAVRLGLAPAGPPHGASPPRDQPVPPASPGPCR